MFSLCRRVAGGCLGRDTLPVMFDAPNVPLPASSLPHDRIAEIPLETSWPGPIGRDEAWGGSTGHGVRVAVLDSGIEAGHPQVGVVTSSWRVELEPDRESVVATDAVDPAGHGTAVAGIIRSLAPDCELHSVQVLGGDTKGTGRALVAGLAWALDHGFEVINLSLATTRDAVAAALRDLADVGYFRRTLIVCSAHNVRMDSHPWRYPAVISVGSHEEQEPLRFYANPRAPVEFYARGVRVPVAWPGGTTATVTGNSFACPHISGICALILAKHPGLTPFQVKSLLHGTADNVENQV